MHSRNGGRCFRSRALVASLLFQMPRESWTPGASVFVFDGRRPGSCG
ncbi:carboxypeptidase [Burkholderia cenocepacia]|nr:carboxypeptidase [Burkholderia cenocepacia]ONV20206.1 carboxypeptidase [Burkholderia cenocepacia]ONV28255.1 carboxypeptidase [Burkholderia cenocepacia]ONV30179.1 carboxypeptidase [Burkholderia cenocepacia]ONV42549.1 carboxypeptidase [Burkholderia cenocepacia]